MATMEQIDNHILFNDLSEIKDTVDDLLNDEEFIAELDKSDTELITRTKLVIDYVDTNINSTDSMLLTESLLSNLRTQTNNVMDWLSDEELFDNEQKLDSLNQALDKLLEYSVYIPMPTKQNLENIKEAATSFRRSIGIQKTNLEKEVNDLKDFSKEVQSELTSCQNESEAFRDKIDEKMSNMESRLEELHQNYLEKENERIDKFMSQKTEFKEKFEEFISEWNNNIKKKLDESKEQFDDLYSNLQEGQDQFIAATQEKLMEYDEMLNGHKISVEELVGVMSTNSMAGHHKEVADKARNSAKNWQRLTIVSFVATIGFSIIALFFQEITTLSWPNLVAKFFVIGSLGSLTAYTARQAKINQELEFNNRTLEVELKTLNPYIASFDNDDQESFKKELFPKIFGRDEKVNALSEKEYENLNMKLMQQLISILEKQSKQ
ncbi:hypothetical protein [Bacillus haynesii]|uniref:hypothetical protein n=1 Tax=Bacillus haynesii TaxID=1925021 RepID=UPI00227F2632|nr:hypothetical protein [Bacillus haynesii]MCY7771670.1 hypothetical protein [Bacillus haynesii]MCY8010859.1 hypothetical protein [Bacillus haynesii]MCY8641267.1 hypothetical protein [Bacillus haynesii]MEC0760949.1 hypothetical protein [Bacillus haynesii]MEC0784567.1 hypothetical protein [Bacillus haynesii]